MAAQIAILMATYNGERFIRAQLESIMCQTFRDWHLYVRDDGSSDHTLTVVKEFSEREPNRVTIVSRGNKHLGPKGNFSCLLGLVRERYVVFSDQDDIWKDDKLDVAHARMIALESRVPSGTPCLVHADRAIVDANGGLVSPSYWRSRRLSQSDFAQPETYLGFCVAAGSTMMINRPLLDLALPIPDAARMHDTWIELVASHFGEIDWIDQVALDHRRHGANASGSIQDIDSPTARAFFSRLKRFWRRRGTQRKIIASYVRQADAFLDRYRSHLPVRSAERIQWFVRMSRRGLLSRSFMALRSRKCLPPGPARKTAFLLLSGGRVFTAEDTLPQSSATVSPS